MKTYLINLPLTDYREAWKIQKELHSIRRRKTIPDTLLLLEHPDVITLGKSGNEENLLTTKNELERMGIQFYRVERGGDITYHGPGQLVGYFIFSLENGIGSLRNFVWKIEESIIRVLKVFDIDGKRKDKFRGVWVNEKKIAAIGLAVRERVTFHGFALNVNPNLNFFNLIVPCGLKFGVTSMKQEKGYKIPMEDVSSEIKNAIESVFKCKLYEVKLEELWQRVP